MQLVFYLPTFSTPCIGHLLYLMFRCDFDVMESLEEFGDLNKPGVTSPAWVVLYRCVPFCQINDEAFLFAT